VLSYLSVPEFDAGWDHLWLEAQLPWPLGLLLTPKHMDRCGPGVGACKW
jgi:hypothetical protein